MNDKETEDILRKVLKEITLDWLGVETPIIDLLVSNTMTTLRNEKYRLDYAKRKRESEIDD